MVHPHPRRFHAEFAHFFRRHSFVTPLSTAEGIVSEVSSHLPKRYLSCSAAYFGCFLQPAARPIPPRRSRRIKPRKQFSKSIFSFFAPVLILLPFALAARRRNYAPAATAAIAASIPPLFNPPEQPFFFSSFTGFSANAEESCDGS